MQWTQDTQYNYPQTQDVNSNPVFLPKLYSSKARGALEVDKFWAEPIK